MKLAILGTGKIVEEVLPVLKEINGIELSAILSTPRSIEKAEKLAELYAISQASSDYDSILANPDVDTVYVALPNHLHYDYAKKALLAGKHVICEKPFTLTLAEFEDLAKIAEQKNRILLEAITNQYLGNFASIKLIFQNLVKSRLSSAITHNIHLVTMPLNVAKLRQHLTQQKVAEHYVTSIFITFIWWLVCFGKPEKVQYLANVERDVDTSGILIMDYGHFKAACIGAKDCSADIKSTIQGNKGSIAVLGPTNSMPELSLALNGQSMTMINENSLNHRMHDEFVAFQAIIEHKDMAATKLALDHSRLVMEVLEAAVKSM